MFRRIAMALFAKPVPLFCVGWLVFSVFTVIFWFYRQRQGGAGFFVDALPSLFLVFCVFLMSVEYRSLKRRGSPRAATWLAHALTGLLLAASMALALAPVYFVRDTTWWSEDYAAICSRGSYTLGVVRGKSCNFIDLVKFWMSDRVRWVRLSVGDIDSEDQVEHKSVARDNAIVDVIVYYRRQLRLGALAGLYQTNRDVSNCQDALKLNLTDLVGVMLKRDPEVDPKRIIAAVRDFRDDYFELSEIRVEICYSSRNAVEFR